MYNPYKGIFSQMSWALEYHLGINSAYASLFIMGIGFGAAMWLMRKILIHFGRRTWAVPILGMYFLFRMNGVCATLYTCSTRLKNILGNFEVVMASDKYAKTFLSAIGLPFNEKTRGSLSYIAYFMNKSEWEKAMRNTGNLGWYFGKVGINLLEITNVFGCHISVPAIKQGFFAYIPATVVCLLGIYIIKNKKEIAEGILFLCMAAACVISSFGAAYFVISMLLWYIVICHLKFPTKKKIKAAIKGSA